MIKKFYSKFKKIIIIITCILITSNSYAEKKITTINVAILDNFHFQPYITSHFSERYVQGIELANSDLWRRGYRIRYKIFGYDRTNPLAILESIKKVKKWNPDVILGPRNSNMFLLTNNKFKNILVLSAFATSDEVTNMPKNYYSLMPPDKEMAIAMYHYFKTKFNHKGIYAIVESDCKNCMDLMKVFSKKYNENNNKHMIIRHYFQSDIADINIKKIMSKYKKGNIIFLPNTAYTTAIMMLKITNFLNEKTIFLGGDGWGDWRNTEVAKLIANKPYYGIHLTPVSLKFSDNLTINRFKDAYKHYYKKKPSGDAALLGYNEIVSIVAALVEYGSQYKNESLRLQILNSYQSALSKNNSWYRSKEYAVYKVDTNGEKYLTSVHIYGGGVRDGS